MQLSVSQTVSYTTCTTLIRLNEEVLFIFQLTVKLIHVNEELDRVHIWGNSSINSIPARMLSSKQQGLVASHSLVFILASLDNPGSFINVLLRWMSLNGKILFSPVRDCCICGRSLERSLHFHLHPLGFLGGGLAHFHGSSPSL